MPKNIARVMLACVAGEAPPPLEILVDAVSFDNGALPQNHAYGALRATQGIF